MCKDDPTKSKNIEKRSKFEFEIMTAVQGLLTTKTRLQVAYAIMHA